MQKENGKVQKTVKVRTAVLIAILASILVGAAVAALLVTHQINTQIIVKPKVSMGVFDTDGHTPLTYIDCGQFELGSGFYFPGHTESEPTEFYFINNTDQVSFYISFDIQNPDPQIQWNFAVKRGDKTSFEWISLGAIYQYPIETKLVNTDPKTQFAYFFFKITIGSGATFGTYTPTILIHAYDSASG